MVEHRAGSTDFLGNKGANLNTSSTSSIISKLYKCFVISHVLPGRQVTSVPISWDVFSNSLDIYVQLGSPNAAYADLLGIVNKQMSDAFRQVASDVYNHGDPRMTIPGAVAENSWRRAQTALYNLTKFLPYMESLGIQVPFEKCTINKWEPEP